MRINRFVFLNLPILSLGEHLGLTVSPHSPLPAGYVTLPANSRSPPLGLMLFHSEEQASSYLLPPCIPRISTSANAESRRTVGDIRHPNLVRQRSAQRFDSTRFPRLASCDLSSSYALNLRFCRQRSSEFPAQSGNPVAAGDEAIMQRVPAATAVLRTSPGCAYEPL